MIFCKIRFQSFAFSNPSFKTNNVSTETSEPLKKNSHSKSDRKRFLIQVNKKTFESYDTTKFLKIHKIKVFHQFIQSINKLYYSVSQKLVVNYSSSASDGVGLGNGGSRRAFSNKCPTA